LIAAIARDGDGDPHSLADGFVEVEFAEFVRLWHLQARSIRLVLSGEAGTHMPTIEYSGGRSFFAVALRMAKSNFIFKII
jgi:hypothetical protein